MSEENPVNLVNAVVGLKCQVLDSLWLCRTTEV
jgi:hypothetical protein